MKCSIFCQSNLRQKARGKFGAGIVFLHYSSETDSEVTVHLVCRVKECKGEDGTMTKGQMDTWDCVGTQTLIQASWISQDSVYICNTVLDYHAVRLPPLERNRGRFVVCQGVLIV